MAPKKKGQRMALDEFLMDESFGGSGGGSGSWADEDMPLPSAGGDGWGLGGAGLSAPPLGGSMGGPLSGPPLGSYGMGSAPLPTSPPYTARVNNLSFDANDAILREFLVERGLRPDSVRVLKDSETGRARGSAFVDFEDLESLKKSLTLRDAILQGRPIHFAVAEQRGNRDGPELNWRAGRRELGPMQEMEPELDWAAARRSGPPLQAPASERPGMERFRRGPGSSAPGGAGSGFGSGAPPRREYEEEQLDWSSRRSLGPSRGGPGGAGPRRPREPEPEIDWSQRTGPLKPLRQSRSGFSESRRGGRDTADQALEDWGRRRVTSGSAPAPKAPVSKPAAAAPAPQSSGSDKSAKLQHGFGVLSIEDEEDDEDKQEADSEPKPEAKSVGELQKAELAKKDDGSWTKA